MHSTLIYGLRVSTHKLRVRHTTSCYNLMYAIIK